MTRTIALCALGLLAVAAAPTVGYAQEAAGDAVPTSGGAGYVDPNAKIAPAGQGRTVTVPAPKRTLYKGPLDRLADIPRSNFLTNLHGSVGVMVGSHNTRAAYANVHGPIGDNAAFGLSFATVHSDALPFYDSYAGYGGYTGLDEVYPSGAALGYGSGSGWRRGPGYGYGYGSGTSTTVGASLQLGGQDSKYDRVWPNYAPPREETTDVTDEPLSSSE